MSLPKTFSEVSANVLEVALRMKTHELLGLNEKMMQDIVNEIASSTLEAAGIRIEDGLLIYPSTTGTSTPRYQVEGQRNPRWKR